MDLAEFQVLCKWRLGRARQHRNTIILPLAIPHSDLVHRQIDILDSNPQRLQETQARAIQQQRDQLGRTRHAPQDLSYLIPTQYDR